MQEQTLIQVLTENEHVNALIKQAAEELSFVNATLKQELALRGPLPATESTLERNEAVERMLHDARNKLMAVNQALQSEVRVRDLVVHQLAAAEEQEAGARNAALHDILTGLPNRALFNDRLEHGIAQATRHQWILTVMFMDLDAFKSINDTYGHAAGDAVLKTVAMRLKENTRDEDTVSRHGGDEFLCLLTQIQGKADIAKFAGKMLTLIRAPCNVMADSHTVSLSIGASIGVAIFPEDGVTAPALIKSADAAMYRAKQNKSGYAFAH